MTQECYNFVEHIKAITKHKFKKDSGFSGYTHALSGVAVSLILVGFFPSFMVNFGVAVIPTIIAFVVAFVGSTLVPDLDNTNSTSKSSLGFFGAALSTAFRASSQIIQTVVRLPKDDPTPNPHRGFYHTILSSVIMGVIVFLLTSISTSVDLAIFGKKTIGDLFAVFFLFLLTHLTISALGGSKMKRRKKSMFAGEIIALAFSLIVAFILLYFLPKDGNYLWLASALTLGCVVHIIGDGFTRYGVPLLFPIPRKRKMWWYYRFARLESGGAAEKAVLPIVFSTLGLIGLIKIISNFITF